MVNNRVMANLPPIYHDIKEFEGLTETIAIELDELDVAKKTVEDEQFIMSASEKSTKKRENDWQIRADPSIETLDFRKKRIINRQSTKLPLSERKVNEILGNLVGNTNFTTNLDVEACTSDFIFDVTEQSIAREIDETLDRVLPLNIHYRVVQKMGTELFFSCTALSGEEITIYPWSPTMIELKVNAELGSMAQSYETITVYPI